MYTLCTYAFFLITYMHIPMRSLQKVNGRGDVMVVQLDPHGRIQGSQTRASLSVYTGHEYAYIQSELSGDRSEYDYPVGVHIAPLLKK